MAKSTKTKEKCLVAVQFAGKSYDVEEIQRLCREDYLNREDAPEPIAELSVYVNVDEQKAYYVVNDIVKGWFVAL